jgi:alkanesulfonate monooxygenase SsuD/methylene tetrahydromethanopterin reductase-like flavin-dependent oxidoreductase (luciferase family)
MKIGFGLITCQRYPGDRRSWADVYADALDLAVAAEEAGFDSVWTSEHHFLDDGYMPSLLPFCSAIAARTERVQIGTACLLAPLYEPLRLAEDAATVDLISRGRFVLGLGQGWRGEEFEAFGAALEQRHVALEDAIAVLRQAGRGGPVTGGALSSYPGVFVTPQPANDVSVPVWIAGGSRAAVKRAGRIAEGFIGNFGATPDEYAQQVEWILEELDERGVPHDQFTFSLHLPTFATTDGDAWRTILPYYAYLQSTYARYHAGDRSTDRKPLSLPTVTAADEERLRRGIVAGTPAEVVEQLRAYERAAGVELHFIARLYWPGLAPEQQREALELYAREVIPALR